MFRLVQSLLIQLIVIVLIAMTPGKIMSSAKSQQISSSQNIHAPMTQCVLAAEGLTSACKEIKLTGAVPFAFKRISFREHEVCPHCQKMCTANLHTSSILLARGGQFQLYGRDSDSPLATMTFPGAYLAHVKICPSASAGGFLLKDRLAVALIQLADKDKSSVETTAC